MPVRGPGTATVELVSEFIEAVTHEILYRRGLYDPNIFERERLYGIALHKSRHPDLNIYISDSIISLKVCLELKTVNIPNCSFSLLLKNFPGEVQRPFNVEEGLNDA